MAQIRFVVCLGARHDVQSVGKNIQILKPGEIHGRAHQHEVKTRFGHGAAAFAIEHGFEPVLERVQMQNI